MVLIQPKAQYCLIGLSGIVTDRSTVVYGFKLLNIKLRLVVAVVVV